MPDLKPLLYVFERYSSEQAPFMHKQLAEWEKTRPLSGLNVINHVPLVTNTLLKITCLVAAGANVTVTNPFFMEAYPEVVTALQRANIFYARDINVLQHKEFDLYFDCGAELYQKLGAPRIGAVELTASGDQYYRAQNLSFPVVSIDSTYTKQLETVFGSAHSANLAIAKLAKVDPAKKSWMIFGFGKIGRGLGYFCVQNKVPVVVVDLNKEAREDAENFGINTIDPNQIETLKAALSQIDIVITATGGKNILKNYPKDWFAGKILANMGLYDEIGQQFKPDEALNNKLPVNFALDDPTPIEYIDPEFYAHNIAALTLLPQNLTPGVHDLAKQTDQDIITAWCQYHHTPFKDVTAWFIK